MRSRNDVAYPDWIDSFDGPLPAGMPLCANKSDQ